MPSSGASAATAPCARNEATTASTHEASYQQGFAAGRQQGLSEAAAEEASLARVLQEKIESAEKAHHAVQSQMAQMDAQAQALARKLRTLEAVLSSLREARAEVIEAAQDDLLTLCLGLTTQVFETSVLHPDALRSLIRRASNELHGRAPLRIHLHPQDVAWLQPPLHEDASQGEADAPTRELVADDAVALGGCIVHGEHAAVDARLEQQLQVFRERLAQIRQQRDAAKRAPGEGGA
jgi:flagellar assembly protein FliH